MDTPEHSRIEKCETLVYMQQKYFTPSLFSVFLLIFILE